MIRLHPWRAEAFRHRRLLAATLAAALSFACGVTPAPAQTVTSPPPPCTALGSAAGTCMQGADARVTSVAAVTGAVKENGAGAASQASASDLSNGVTGTAGTPVVLATSPSIATPTLTGNVTLSGLTGSATRCAQLNSSGVLGANANACLAPAGSTNTIQLNGGSGALASMLGYSYSGSGTTDTLAGPDSSAWSIGGGFKVGSASKIDLNGTALKSNTTWVIAGEPGCASGAGGATWLIGVSPTQWCTSTTSLATDNIGIGTIVLGVGGGGTETSGCCNTVMGSENAKNITSGQYNTGVGFESLHTITTGSYNSAFGDSTMPYLTTGTGNVAVGQGAGGGVTTGSYNICIVSNCGGNNTMTGSSNVQIGSTDPLLTSGSSNIFICAGTGSCGYGIATGNGCVVIGAQTTTLPDQSDCIVFGDADPTTGHILFRYIASEGYLHVMQSSGFSGSLAVDAGLSVGVPTGGLEGSGTLNIAGDYYANGVAGVASCSGVPTSSFAVKNGIVTHC